MSINQMMFDIETMSRRPNAAIASIGAVIFNQKDGIIDKFYTNVSLAEGKKLGLHFCQNTINWWKERPKEVRDALMENPRSIKESILGLYDFYRSHNCKTAWCWGTSFDCPITISSAVAVGIPDDSEPWKYSEMKCARTLCSMFDFKPDRDPTKHHNALDDSIAQVECLLKLYNELY